MTFTTDQASGIADRTVSNALVWVVSFFLGKLALAGYLAGSDVPQLSLVIIILGSAAWGWWVNRPKAIVQSAAALPGTLVVTTPDLSSATPQTNIVSNIANSVIDKVTKKVVEVTPSPK